MQKSEDKKQGQLIGIVGSGIAGLSCGKALVEKGYAVELFDKGRNVGGRVATRITNRDVEAMSFDHGAQYFTAKSEEFKKQVELWIEKGAAAIWRGKIGTLKDGKLLAEERSHERFVGTPGMRSIADQMSQGLSITTGLRISSLSKKDGQWVLNFEDGSHPKKFDAVILAIPPAQAADLLDEDATLQSECRKAQMLPCWATMVTFDSRLPIDVDGIFVEDAAFSWIARDSSKPGRSPGERWVLHATPEWTNEHLEEDALVVQTKALEAFFQVTGLKAVQPSFVKSHRWRYASQVETGSGKLLCSGERGLIVCGDWCHGAKVEGAFLSGLEASGKF